MDGEKVATRLVQRAQLAAVRVEDVVIVRRESLRRSGRNSIGEKSDGVALHRPGLSQFRSG